MLLLWTVSLENLIDAILFENLLCVLLTYVIESWFSPGCSNYFNIVYVQQETKQHKVNTFKNENNRISLRDIFYLSFPFLYLLVWNRKFVIIETHTYVITCGENMMSSLIIQSM